MRKAMISLGAEEEVESMITVAMMRAWKALAWVIGRVVRRDHHRAVMNRRGSEGEVERG